MRIMLALALLVLIPRVLYAADQAGEGCIRGLCVGDRVLRLWVGTRHQRPRTIPGKLVAFIPDDPKTRGPEGWLTVQLAENGKTVRWPHGAIVGNANVNACGERFCVGHTVMFTHDRRLWKDHKHRGAVAGILENGRVIVTRGGHEPLVVLEKGLSTRSLSRRLPRKTPQGIADSPPVEAAD